jgi:hypothetical protein
MAYYTPESPFCPEKRNICFYFLLWVAMKTWYTENDAKAHVPWRRKTGGG